MLRPMIAYIHENIFKKNTYLKIQYPNKEVFFYVIIEDINKNIHFFFQYGELRHKCACVNGCLEKKINKSENSECEIFILKSIYSHFYSPLCKPQVLLLYFTSLPMILNSYFFFDFSFFSYAILNSYSFIFHLPLRYLLLLFLYFSSLPIILNSYYFIFLSFIFLFHLVLLLPPYLPSPMTSFILSGFPYFLLEATETSILNFNIEDKQKR